MVNHKNVAGLRDWLIQRVTAVFLLCYIALVLYMIVGVSNYSGWHTVFQLTWMKWSTLLATAAICWHAWIGLWTIFTDYVKNTKVRKVLEAVVLLLNAFYFLWVIKILWW